jgi:hypothetical protein
LSAVHANRAKNLGKQLFGAWNVRAITLPGGTEIIHSPQAKSPADHETIDDLLTRWRTANELTRSRYKLAGELALCAFCLFGIALVYCWRVRVHL